MAIFSSNATATTVTSSAAAVFTAVAATVATTRDVTIVNRGTAAVALGQSGVSFTTGVLVYPGQQLTIQGTASTIYGIAGSGNNISVIAALASLASVA